MNAKTFAAFRKRQPALAAELNTVMASAPKGLKTLQAAMKQFEPWLDSMDWDVVLKDEGVSLYDVDKMLNEIATLAKKIEREIKGL